MKDVKNRQKWITLLAECQDASSFGGFVTLYKPSGNVCCLKKPIRAEIKAIDVVINLGMLELIGVNANTDHS